VSKLRNEWYLKVRADTDIYSALHESRKIMVYLNPKPWNLNRRFIVLLLLFIYKKS